MDIGLKVKRLHNMHFVKKFSRYTNMRKCARLLVQICYFIFILFTVRIFFFFFFFWGGGGVKIKMHLTQCDNKVLFWWDWFTEVCCGLWQVLATLVQQLIKLLIFHSQIRHKLFIILPRLGHQMVKLIKSFSSRIYWMHIHTSSSHSISPSAP